MSNTQKPQITERIHTLSNGTVLDLSQIIGFADYCGKDNKQPIFKTSYYDRDKDVYEPEVAISVGAEYDSIVRCWMDYWTEFNGEEPKNIMANQEPTAP